MDRQWHHSRTSEQKKAHAEECIDTEVHNAKTRAKDREWSEVEKSLQAVRHWLEVLHGVD